MNSMQSYIKAFLRSHLKRLWSQTNSWLWNLCLQIQASPFLGGGGELVDQKLQSITILDLLPKFLRGNEFRAIIRRGEPTAAGLRLRPRATARHYCHACVFCPMKWRRWGKKAPSSSSFMVPTLPAGSQGEERNPGDPRPDTRWENTSKYFI